MASRSWLVLLLGMILLSGSLSPVYADWTQLGTDTASDASFDETADAEQQDSSVGGGQATSGTYTNTQTSNDQYEVLAETSVSGVYKLGWIYTLSSLSTRIDTQLYVEAKLTNTEKTNAFIAYRDSTTSTSTPKERTWDGGTAAWGSQEEMSTAGSPVRFVQVAYSPVEAQGYYRIVVTLSDDGYLDAYVWDGESWSVTNNIGYTDNGALATKCYGYRCFDVAFEKTSGEALLVYSRGATSNEIGYKAWTPTSGWDSSESTLDLARTSGGVNWVALASAPGTRSGTGDDNEIAMIYIDQNVDVHGYVWTGSAWSEMGVSSVWDATAAIATEECIAVAYEQSTGRAMFIWGDTTATDNYYRIWDGSTLSGPTLLDIPNQGAITNWVSLKADPSSDDLFFVVVDGATTPDLNTAYWSGSAWTVHSETDGGVDSHAGRCADFAWEPTGNKGLLVWGTTAAYISYRTFTAPNTWSSTTDVAMGTYAHRWVQLRTNPRSVSGDVKILGAVYEITNNDIGAIKWDGTTFTVIGSTTISASSVVTYECFEIEFPSYQESMKVQWSTSTSGPWTTLGAITSTTESTLGPYNIADDSTTTLYVRVRDTSKDASASSVSIDYLCIRCYFSAADKTACYFQNDGTYAYFKEELSAAADASSFTYTVYLDKPTGGSYSEDYRMVYSSGTNKLQKWTGSWTDQSTITVTTGVSPDSLTFKVLLSDIANPTVQQDTYVWFIEYKGANSFSNQVDRAPNAGSWTISSTVIPELPWPMPLVFIPAVVLTVGFLYSRRFRR